MKFLAGILWWILEKVVGGRLAVKNESLEQENENLEKQRDSNVTDIDSAKRVLKRHREGDK